MSYIEIRIETDSRHAEALSDALMDAGALSASIEDANGGAFAEELVVDEPGYALPLWSQCAVLALFDSEAQSQLALASVASALQASAAYQYTSREVAEQDWVSMTQSQFPPIEISPRLWIVPSWHTPPRADAINLLLDPGQAFGTGSHPTTKLCLQWLDQHLPRGARVLDYGCGSGILAIAAMKLGAARATGVDIDAKAVATARENAARNDVDIAFFTADEPLAEAKLDAVDITVANILANPLIVLAPLIARATRVGGQIVLSGILQSQAQQVAQAYAPWARLETYGQEQEWVCLAGVRHA